MKSFSLIFTCVLSIILAGCSSNSSEKSISIIATAVPHAEILEQVQPTLEKEGINLKIIVVEDYNTPNRALADGEVDANYFQHPAFLRQQIEDFDYPLEILGAVHLEPMGFYSRKHNSLEEIGDNAQVAVPADPSNQARALELLEKTGLIKLRNHGSKTSILDIAENPHHLKFVEIDSPLLARSLDDVDLAAITTNFALQSGLSPQEDSLALEDLGSDYVNVVVVKKGDATKEKFQKLIHALQSEEVRAFINKKYKGAVIPAF